MRRSPHNLDSPRLIGSFLAAVLFTITGVAHANWFDAGWSFRRSIEVDWDPANPAEEGLCEIAFYTAGRHKSDGSDIRVATDQGRLVPHHVQTAGPGDHVRVVFKLTRPARRYYVYFGNNDPPAMPDNLGGIDWRCGLLLDMRQLQGDGAGNFEQIEQAWERSSRSIGRRMIDRPFIGHNPFDDQERTISSITGSLIAPADGEYTFAVTVDDQAALYIAGKPLVFSRIGPRDARFNAQVQLTRGRHDFMLYHVNTGGPGWVTVAWRMPGEEKYEVIPAEAFGIVRTATVGALEEHRRTLTADFIVEYLGECFIAGNYSHRLRFTARPPRASGAPTFEWDFGSSQTARGETVEHVYLADGVYPVRLTARIGGNQDVQTTRLPVTRDYDRIDKPPTDEPPAHSSIVAGYNVKTMPQRWLPLAARMHLRANQIEPLLAVTARLATENDHPDPGQSMEVLREASLHALHNERPEPVRKLWDTVPRDSNLHPHAARFHGELLLWWLADFDHAVKVLQPYTGSGDETLRRIYAQALVLNQNAGEGAKLLAELPVTGDPARKPALSGALARTVEYFVKEGEWEAGEQQWEQWLAQFPADFMEGYSLLLRVQLMEARNSKEAAARVAEAFATAVPDSSYAPLLLDRASRLLETSDPEKSRALRLLLQQRYPEDPLSQTAQPD